MAPISGAAIGAGFDLACMCDVRLAADDGWWH
jgi:enoyl-CoA hydratase/carnithine racemase